VKNDDVIEADYIPEHSEKKAHVALNVSTDDYTVEDIDEYGSMHSRMALNGLRRMIEELQKGKIKEVPKEKIVMWY
jgi:hypothetical protein